MNINEPRHGTGIILPFFNKRGRSTVGGSAKSWTSSLKSNRLPFIGWIPGVVQGLFIEMFLTALPVFTVFMLAAEKHKGTFNAPIGIGLALFIAELMGVYYTGGSVNPARSFGPAVVSREFHSYHWIYWVGPILGSIVASGFYLLMKMLEYETANPGQDSAAPEGEHFNPDLERGSTSRVSFAPGGLRHRHQTCCCCCGRPARLPDEVHDDARAAGARVGDQAWE